MYKIIVCCVFAWNLTSDDGLLVEWFVSVDFRAFLFAAALIIFTCSSIQSAAAYQDVECGCKSLINNMNVNIRIHNHINIDDDMNINMNINMNSDIDIDIDINVINIIN